MATVPASTVPIDGFQVNRPPATFDPEHDLAQGFLEFLSPLHRRFAVWQPDYEPARQLRLALGKSKRAKKRLVVKAAQQLAVDLWRWRTGRNTMAELGWVAV